MNAKDGGFTLLEILISLTIMGFAAAGLFQLCEYGSLQYRHITEGSSELLAWQILRRDLRRIVATGEIAGMTREELETRIPPDCQLQIAEFTVNQYAQGACFLRFRLYSDRNRNRRADPQELLPPVMLCYRKRSDT